MIGYSVPFLESKNRLRLNSLFFDNAVNKVKSKIGTSDKNRLHCK